MLQLKFYLKDERSGRAIPFSDFPEYVWEDGPSFDEIEGVKFPESTCVAAFFSERGNDKFRLQLAYKPDFQYTRIGGNGEFYTKRHKLDSSGRRIKDENGDFVWEDDNCANLFRGAMGDSVLRLSRRNAAQEWEDIFSLKIEIEPAPDKKELMRMMAMALFPVNPFLVLSNIEGLSKANVNRRWERGDSKEDEWNACIELETVKWMYNRLFPRLYAIVSDSAYCISDKQELVKVRSMRHLNGSDRRRLARLRLRYGSECDMRNIVGHMRCCASNVVAHNVIGTFLHGQLKRLLGISRFLDQMISSKYQLIDEEVDANKRRAYKNAIREEKLMRLKTDKLVKNVQSIMAMGPWSRADLRVSIFDSVPDDFSYNENYRYVYSLIGAFEKMRFLWRNLVGEMLTPTIDQASGRGGQSRWQRNYSYIYESWVFVSLLNAFQACGFQMLNQYRAKIISRAIDSFMGQRNNDPVPCNSESGELTVELFHGVCVPKYDPTKSVVGLSHHYETHDPLTPDFEIRFVKKTQGELENPDEYVIILDAKSGRMLSNEDVLQRTKYAQKIYRNEDMDSPHQVWLVYSGVSGFFDQKKVAAVSGVEFDIDLNGNECWCESDTMQEEAPGRYNGKFHWTLDGISDGKKCKRMKPFVGHLRCNAETMLGKNVFEEFVKVQLKTVRRYFGLD